VPRFHVTWGTGPGLLAPFIARARQAEEKGLLEFRFRHRVDELIVERGAVVGARGARLAPTTVQRGVKSSREVVATSSCARRQVIIASGGIGGNHELVRRYWPTAMGAPPHSMVCGVPASTDGAGLGIVARAGGRVINNDRMWHYTEGVRNWNPVWPTMASGSCPGRPRYGWTPTVCDSLPHSFPDSTHSRRCVTS
jgi:predicted oxidoreductase